MYCSILTFQAVMLMVVVLHARFFRRTLLTTRIFITFSITVFLFQVIHQPKILKVSRLKGMFSMSIHMPVDATTSILILQQYYFPPCTDDGHDSCLCQQLCHVGRLHGTWHPAPVHHHSTVHLDAGSGESSHVTIHDTIFWLLCHSDLRLRWAHHIIMILSSCQAVSLWVNFMGFTDGKEPLVIYGIVCWGETTSYIIVCIFHPPYIPHNCWNSMHCMYSLSILFDYGYIHNIIYS